MTLNIKILPSLLAADMGRLEEEARRSIAAGADGLHIDIMDGHFVHNLSMGPAVVKAARGWTDAELSVHLMVTHPQHYVEAFADAGADMILIHVEAQCDAGAVIDMIRARSCRGGYVLNPETPAAALEDTSTAPDEVLCMTVHPGFGGQAFIREVLPKISDVRSAYPGADISVDGGINVDTALECAGQGANVFLAGTSLLRAPDMSAEIARMRKEAKSVLREAAS